MNILKVCGIVICILCICIIFRNLKNEYSFFIKIIVTIGASILCLATFYPILSYIQEISQGSYIQKYISILTKALGISILVQITSDVCKDAGEPSLSQKVELFAKAEILLLSIPVIKDLFSFCNEVMR